MLDASEKPVIAAIHGYALGGGLEIAMACHYRVALPSARVGLPEVLIGILPGGGGTQRLPRLIGAKAALDMIVTGRHVPAPEAKKLGIIDELLPENADLHDGAIAYAMRIMDVRPLPRVRDRAVKLEDPGIFDAMRKSIARRARNQMAPYHCIAAVEAACTLAFDDGCRREADLFKELENSDEARALRYAFFIEREVARLPDLPVQHAGARLRHCRGGGRRHDGRRHRHELRRPRLAGEDHGCRRRRRWIAACSASATTTRRRSAAARWPRTRCSAGSRASNRWRATRTSPIATW